MSKRVWICQHPKCHARVKVKPTGPCLTCNHPNLWYFPSMRQADRWAHLLMQESYGMITELRHEVPFKFEENGKTVFTYRADAVYIKISTGEEVVEDTKATMNPKGHDPEFKLKKKLIEARFGITINIVTGR